LFKVSGKGAGAQGIGRLRTDFAQKAGNFGGSLAIALADIALRRFFEERNGFGITTLLGEQSAQGAVSGGILGVNFQEAAVKPWRWWMAAIARRISLLRGWANRARL